MIIYSDNACFENSDNQHRLLVIIIYTVRQSMDMNAPNLVQLKLAGCISHIALHLTKPPN